ncbi:MAG: hypothetical protein U5L05_19230 [Rubrivivax sp.]|nr:hypothetical protein [Rubrivivax sp.]
MTDFGFNFAGVKRHVELARDSDAAHRHFWAVQTVKTLAGGATLLFGLAWSAVAGTQQARLIALAVAVGSAAAICFPMWFLFGRQKVIWISSSLLVARVSCLLAVVIVVQGPPQLQWAVIFTLGAPMLAAIFLLADLEVRAQLRPCLDKLGQNCAPRRLREQPCSGCPVMV